MNNIKIVYRNYGHWDFYSHNENTPGRQFRLRGSGVSWFAIDEREDSHRSIEFKTFTLALAFITETMMHENLVPDGFGNNKKI